MPAPARSSGGRASPNDLKPPHAANTNCSNTEQATPVIDKAQGVIYFTTSDGKLRGAALADGAERLTPTPWWRPSAATGAST